jgi:hypothetical protein
MRYETNNQQGDKPMKYQEPITSADETVAMFIIQDLTNIGAETRKEVFSYIKNQNPSSKYLTDGQFRIVGDIERLLRGASKAKRNLLINHLYNNTVLCTK